MSKLMMTLLLAGRLVAAAEPVDGIYKMGPDVTPPKIKKNVDPNYPEEYRQERLSGVVKLQCVINTEGVAVDIEVLQSFNAAFDHNAIAALRQWRFEPAKRNGVVVPVRVKFEISFRYLDGPPANRR